MTHRTTVVRIDDLPADEQEIIWHQRLIEHTRHQAKVGRLSQWRRQMAAHSKHVVRMSHYMSKPRALTVRHWTALLTQSDFRAYQAKIAAIDLADPESYFWWFGLGDESRYHLIRVGTEAVRDEHEQMKKYRYAEKMKKLRENGLA